MKANITRKQFIRSSAIAAAAIPLGTIGLNASEMSETGGLPGTNELTGAADKISISIFSKHLHWLNYKDMATLAAQLGYDGVDLTVRKDGHVQPESVTTDLPKAIDAIRNAGLQVYTITTDIKTADEPHTAVILKTAASLGIKNYRMGWYGYTG
ncbi:MAG TPA: hypothetical protein VK541_13550, partial [Pedobacter sp.]|nr:hypothetical protein [Pedobacter sp.]